MTAVAAAQSAETERAGTVLELDSRPEPWRRLAGELWASRGLIVTLSRKDFFVRYRRSKLGTFWILALPLIQASVLAIVFSRLAHFDLNGASYPVFVFSGIVAWSFFSGAMNGASTSIVDGQSLATKIYFPRCVLPISRALTEAYGLGASLAVLLVLSVAFRVHIGIEILIAIPAAVLVLALAIAFGLVLSALHVYFRDIRFILGAITLPWFYVTPIFYPPSAIGTGALRTAIDVNPATGPVLMLRESTVGGVDWQHAALASLCWTVALLAVGLVLQRRFDRVLSDLL